MGYQVGAQCFGDAITAASVSASSEAGRLVVLGSEVYGVEVAGVDASSISYTLRSALGSSLELVVPYAAQPCGLLEAADGALLGWALASVWLAVFAVLQMKRAVL